MEISQEMIDNIRRIAEALTPIWEAVKRTMKAAYDALRQYFLKAYVGSLQLEYYSLTSVLNVTKKTVARNKIIRRQVRIKDLIRRVQGAE